VAALAPHATRTSGYLEATAAWTALAVPADGPASFRGGAGRFVLGESGRVNGAEVVLSASLTADGVPAVGPESAPCTTAVLCTPGAAVGLDPRASTSVSATAAAMSTPSAASASARWSETLERRV
jgi:hypothetical protein